MEALYQAIRRSKTAISQEAIWYKILSKPAVKKYIINLVQDQLKNSIDGNNQRIEDTEGNYYYSKLTEQITGGRKRHGDPYTLFDTGEFYNSIIVRVGKLEFLMDGDPIKTDEDGNKTNLFEKYGNEIVGITEENQSKIAIKIKEEINQEIRNYLFRKSR
jgi:hypothetical protein